MNTLNKLAGVILLLGIILIIFWSCQPNEGREQHNTTVDTSSIVAVGYLYTADSMDITREFYSDGRVEDIGIPLKLYPHWRIADSLMGVDARGGDSWCEIASGTEIGM